MDCVVVVCSGPLRQWENSRLHSLFPLYLPLSFLFTLASLPLFDSVEYVFSIKVDIMLPRFIERTNELGNNGRDAMKAINFNSVCSPPLPAANEASKGQDEANCCSCC